MSHSSHPSTFELDVYYASSAAEREHADVRGHVVSCERCGAYIEELNGLASPLPSASPSPARWRKLAPIAGMLALAACVVLFVTSRRTDDPGYIGVKGVPAAQILLRRDGNVRVWDGIAPVRPGDVIAVSVACEHFVHVTVSAAGNGGLARLWEGGCPHGPASALPFTLVVDGQPGSEHFSVVLSRAPLADDRLKTVLRTSARDVDAWTIDFAFAKEER